MNLSRIYAIVVRQVFLLLHNPTRFINIFLWIAIDIVLWGFVTKYLDLVGQSGFSFTNLIFGAVILWAFFTRVMQGVSVAFMEDLWTQNFINLFASPLRLREYLAGLVAASILTSAAGFIFIIGLGGLAFGYDVFMIGLSILPFLLILFIFGVSLGFIGSAIILRFGPSAEWLVWPITAVLSPLAGVYYPISVLPAVFQFAARMVPPTYVFESMRSLILNGDFLPLVPDLIIGFILSLGYLVLSCVFFVRVYKSVLNKGSIVRFSAESA